MMKRRLALLLGGMLCAVAVTQAAVRSAALTYQSGGTTLEGWLAYDDATTAKRPAVLIVHQWMGLTDYEKRRASMLAEMGYVVLAADIYGQGVRPANTQEAGAMAGKYKNDRNLLRERVNAALAKLKAQPLTDPARVAAIGYCFGGTTVLELARSGAELNGVVSFHGGLGSPTPADAKNIRSRVLVLHGADDPYVPAAEVEAFQKEMREAKVDWQFVAYGGAVHSFTHKESGTDASRGAAYNEPADRRSWEAMQVFFKEIFR